MLTLPNILVKVVRNHLKVVKIGSNQKNFIQEPEEEEKTLFRKKDFFEFLQKKILSGHFKD